MKLTLNVLENHHNDTDKRWPNYMFGGRIRTSTLALIVLFCATWWTYNTYKPQPPPPPPPAQVVPPGYLPDPNYTWVPRTRVQEPRYDTPTRTPTTTVTTTTPPTTPPTTTTTPPPLFQLPVLPPPFGPGTTPPSPAPPGPTPAPAPAPGLPGLPGLPR